MQLKAINVKPGDKDKLVTGLFSKKEAAEVIANGCRHIHSSTLGARDACALISREMLERSIQIPFPWELVKDSTLESLRTSRERHALIHSIASGKKITGRRDLKEKMTSVLEELVTNAIYHSYVERDDTPRYPRQKPAVLADSERVDVRYHIVDEGIYLSVSDRGGGLSFSSVSRAFARCYGKRSEAQIEDKEGGAGLGLYMVFETVTHLKFVTVPGVRTEICCWIADKRSFDPDHFSLNFFEWREK